MNIGLVGLPFSGKTTLFEAITKTKVDPYHPSIMKNKCIPHIVDVVDERIEKLNEVYKPKKKIPPKIEFVDFAGVSKEENFQGFDTVFLNGIKMMDAFVFVLRGFEYGGTQADPQNDFDTLFSEFLISDQIIIESRLERLERQIKKTNKPELKEEKSILERCMEFLNKNIPLKDAGLNAHELKILKGFQFLTLKPVLLVLNLDEDTWNDNQDPKKYLNEETLDKYSVKVIAGLIERDIALMDDEDTQVFMEEYGIKESAMNTMIKASFDVLSQIYFFTVGEDEVRAWIIEGNCFAQKAAGAIHSDIERGFIRAEVVSYEDFKNCDFNMVKTKEKGVWRLEGKEYEVKDGDIISFRFAV